MSSKIFYDEEINKKTCGPHGHVCTERLTRQTFPPYPREAQKAYKLAGKNNRVVYTLSARPGPCGKHPREVQQIYSLLCQQKTAK